ncbi:MAG: DUF2189 domain-containing protein [Thiobacillaceae bacterium]|nr:DUF2189 domain-containing protein [Thiobacillaceae bacterium]
MSTETIKPHTRHIDLPELRRVELARPFQWLRRGWGDFIHHWPLSLTLGVLFAVLGFLLIDYVWARLHLAMALTSGFLLVAPFLAIVFYDISRRAEQPVPTRAFDGVRANAGSIGMFGFMLAFILSAWERISAILVGLFLKTDIVTDQPFTLGLLLAPEHMGFVVPYMLIGGAVAALVFALSVVSLPMLMDRKVDFITAVVTSLWVVRENPGTMLVWAALIAVLGFIGLIAWFIPLAVIFPVLGHATWHAYRDLVGRE